MNHSITNKNDRPFESQFLLEENSAKAMRIEPSYAVAGQSSTAIRLPVVPSMHRTNDSSKIIPKEMYNNIKVDSEENGGHGGSSSSESYFFPTGDSAFRSMDQQGRADTANHHYTTRLQRTHTFSDTSNHLPAPSSASLSPRTMTISGHQQQQQQLTDTPPPSFIYASSRINFAAAPIVKIIRQKVRTMTKGTRLLPATATTVNNTSNDHRPVTTAAAAQNNKEYCIRLVNSAIDIPQTHCVLGAGSFSLVTSVTIDSTRGNINSNSNSNAFLNDRQEQRIKEQQRYYACKTIKQELIATGGDDFVLAASQLAYEAHVLSCLDHPNIIKIRGLDDKGVLGFERTDRGFFLLMDVLCETLQQRIDRWRKSPSSSSSSVVVGDGPDSNNNHTKNNDLILLRRHLVKLGMCLQLASALEHVHDKNIVYRDLKPANIGFASVPSPNHHPEGEEIYNTLQLFDFGLCHEFTSTSTTLTGVIGTMRYMAPEVCLAETNYDYGCDIYSYAVVCWELWTHRIPFESMTTPDMYRKFVCRRGYRPYPDQSEEQENHHSPPEFCLNNRRHPYQQQQHDHHNRNGVVDPAPVVQMDRSVSSLQQDHQPSTTPLNHNYPIPKEISVLLSQAWTHDPKSRIRWSRIRKQLTLFKSLVDLQLEAQDLSDSAANNNTDFDYDDDANDNDYNYGGGDYMPEISPDFVTSNDYCNTDRETW